MAQSSSGAGTSSEKAHTDSPEIEILHVVIHRDGKQIEAKWGLHPNLKEELKPEEWKELTESQKEDKNSNPCLSVVVPVFNEEGNIGYFVERTLLVLRSMSLTFELILVDDGSDDKTWEQIVELQRSTPELIGYRLSRNFGHQGALLAGLHGARGRAVISMDGDLQHPPEIIPQLVRAWNSGAKIVLTRRLDQDKNSIFKRFSSRFFYRIFSLIAETEIESGTSDFRLIDQQALKELLRFNFGDPFLRGAVQTLGFPQATVEFEMEKRYSGESKYTLPKMLRFARHGLISHSSVPLRVGIWLGMFTGLVSILGLAYVVSQFFLGHTVPGWASTLGLLSLLFSVLFIILGIIGLYLEDIHQLLKQRPHFIISNQVGPETIETKKEM